MQQRWADQAYAECCYHFQFTGYRGIGVRLCHPSRLNYAGLPDLLGTIDISIDEWCELGTEAQRRAHIEALVMAAT